MPPARASRGAKSLVRNSFALGCMLFRWKEKRGRAKPGPRILPFATDGRRQRRTNVCIQHARLRRRAPAESGRDDSTAERLPHGRPAERLLDRRTAERFLDRRAAEGFLGRGCAAKRRALAEALAKLALVERV